MTRRRLLWHAVHGLGGLALVAGLGACADTLDKEEEEKAGVPKPEWRVGDRWVFQRTSLGGTTSVVTYQVVEATGDGYALRLSGAGPDLTSYWTDELALRRREVIWGVSVNMSRVISDVFYGGKRSTTTTQKVTERVLDLWQHPGIYYRARDLDRHIPPPECCIWPPPPR